MCRSPTILPTNNNNNDNVTDFQSTKQLPITRPVSPTSAIIMSLPSSPLSSPSSVTSSRVSFDDSATVITTITPSSSMSNDERCDIWYQSSDLNNFKVAARNFCRHLRDNVNNENECTRGLEQRISLERQRNKCLTLRCILKAQQRYAGQPDQLAMIAAKCTAWAQQVAQCAAQEDYQQAYDDDDESRANKHPTPQVSQPIVAFPLAAFQFKRSSSPMEEDNLSINSARRVRARTQQ